MNRLRPFWLLALSLILVACAGPLGLEKPKVNITSFRALPAASSQWPAEGIHLPCNDAPRPRVVSQPSPEIAPPATLAGVQAMH